MRKQRKIVSLLLVLAMILTTGCGEDPIETFKKAMDNLNKAENMTLEGEGKMTMSISGQNMEMDLGFSGDYVKSTTDDPCDLQLAFDVNYAMMGQKAEMKLYVKDKTVYAEGNGAKTKTKLDKDGLEQLRSFADEKNSIPVEKYVKESSQDGDKLKLKLDTEKFIADFMKKYSGIFNSGATPSAGTFDAKSFQEQIKNAGLEDMELDATVKDENFTSMKYSLPFKMDGAAYGTTQKIEGDLVFDLSKISINNDIKEITIPDEKSFKEATSM